MGDERGISMLKLTNTPYVPNHSYWYNENREHRVVAFAAPGTGTKFEYILFGCALLEFFSFPKPFSPSFPLSVLIYQSVCLEQLFMETWFGRPCKTLLAIVVRPDLFTLKELDYDTLSAVSL